MPAASILTIGDEILIGQITDTNSAHVARALQENGYSTRQMISVGDNRREMLRVLRSALRLSDVVIMTGGLGPTKDDITKGVLAQLLGTRQYVEHSGQWAIVQDILRDRGLDVLPVNRAQAAVPLGADVICNPRGTAPVMVLRFPRERFGHEATLYALPGVPHEAVALLPSIMEDLRAHNPSAAPATMHQHVMVYGIAESALSERLASWEDALPRNMHLAYLPNTLTGIHLRLTIESEDRSLAQTLLERETAALLQLLGPLAYATDEDTLEHVVGQLLLRQGKTLSCAESCTGGNIAHLLTSVPGASNYFLGSVTSYAISVKEKVLEVPGRLIQDHGVVSSEVAAAMAEGVRRLTGSDYAVATTGLAGPGGDGTHPEGTVWMGVTGPAGTRTECFHSHGDRIRNIERFSAAALNFLRRYLLENA